MLHPTSRASCGFGVEERIGLIELGWYHVSETSEGIEPLRKGENQEVSWRLYHLALLFPSTKFRLNSFGSTYLHCWFLKPKNATVHPLKWWYQSFPKGQIKGMWHLICLKSWGQEQMCLSLAHDGSQCSPAVRKSSHEEPTVTKENSLEGKCCVRSRFLQQHLLSPLGCPAGHVLLPKKWAIHHWLSS